ncbi:MAG TPA: hypothetical protein VFY36_03670 [Solirubrobacteraceae bacterium]|nr:hypothetical protein [Solirubrobacteraceae bacterium]
MSVLRETEPPLDEVRARAIQQLLDAEPMSVEDWPIMKRQMIEDMNASGMSIFDTYD